MSTGIFVTIRYVDGSYVHIPAYAWEAVPGEGIDYIEIANPLVCRIASASLYWLYEESGTIVAGFGSIGYDPNPLVEIIFDVDGGQTERKIDYMPDLRLSQVKLGHWWPGAEKPVRTYG